MNKKYYRFTYNGVTKSSRRKFENAADAFHYCFGFTPMPAVLNNSKVVQIETSETTFLAKRKRQNEFDILAIQYEEAVKSAEELKKKIKASPIEDLPISRKNKHIFNKIKNEN